MPSWRDRLQPVYTRRPVEVEIHGETVKFWPLRTLKVLEVLVFARPLLTMLADIFSDNIIDKARTRMSKSFGQGMIGSEDSVTGGEDHAQGIPVEVVKLAYERRDESMNKVADAICDNKNWLLLTNCVIDSARELFPKEELEARTVHEVLDDIDLETLLLLLGGVWEASKSVFGPFLKNEGLSSKLSAAREDIATKLMARMGIQEDSTNLPDQSTTESSSSSEPESPSAQS